MSRRVWVIAAPTAVLAITFLLFAWMSLSGVGEAKAAKAPQPAGAHAAP
jgi:hypothetical protein